MGRDGRAMASQDRRASNLAVCGDMGNTNSLRGVTGSVGRGQSNAAWIIRGARFMPKQQGGVRGGACLGAVIKVVTISRGRGRESAQFGKLQVG